MITMNHLPGLTLDHIAATALRRGELLHEIVGDMTRFCLNHPTHLCQERLRYPRHCWHCQEQRDIAADNRRFPHSAFRVPLSYRAPAYRLAGQFRDAVHLLRAKLGSLRPVFAGAFPYGCWSEGVGVSTDLETGQTFQRHFFFLPDSYRSQLTIGARSVPCLLHHQRHLALDGRLAFHGLPDGLMWSFVPNYSHRLTRDAGLLLQAGLLRGCSPGTDTSVGAESILSNGVPGLLSGTAMIQEISLSAQPAFECSIARAYPAGAGVWNLPRSARELCKELDIDPRMARS
jgi:hypothetical protein